MPTRYLRTGTWLLRLLTVAAASVPAVVLADIDQIGSNAPGISQMWSDIKCAFPHTDLGAQGFTFVLARMVDIILRFIGGGAVLMIIYGGIRMMMTVADENSHSEAKKVVLYACLGLILAIMADAIVLYTISLVESAAG